MTVIGVRLANWMIGHRRQINRSIDYAKERTCPLHHGQIRGKEKKRKFSKKTQIEKVGGI